MSLFFYIIYIKHDLLGRLQLISKPVWLFPYLHKLEYERNSAAKKNDHLHIKCFFMLVSVGFTYPMHI